ncbi:MAG: serine/threonine protein kinase [Planctomycetales bacterium]|nr:serine/threonine protein kinase [Planctomycetales bacterium]
MHDPQNHSRSTLILLVDEYRRLTEENSLTVEEFLTRYPHVDQDEFQRELDWDRKFDWGHRFASTATQPSHLLSEFLTGDCDLAEPMLRAVLDQRFEEKEVLGQGGFGLVLRCFDCEMQRDVAVKIPRNLNRTDRDFVIKEARAAARVKHPHVATIYDVIKVGDSAMIVSEFIDGQTLQERLASAVPLTTSAAVRMVIAIAQGVQAAHDHHLIHSDLKPANVIIDPLGRPQIIDFGLSSRTQGGRLLPDQIIGGTPEYMAPECRDQDRPRISFAADIYSLGVILMELLIGPTDHSLTEIKQIFASNNKQKRRQISNDLTAICRRCVADNPDNRYASAMHLAHDLQRYLDYLPVQARTYSWLKRSWMWCMRNRTLATGLASAAVLSVVIISALSWINAQSRAAEAEQRKLTAVARQERDNATNAREQSDQILQFVQDNIFRSFNTQAFGGLGKEIRLRDAVVAGMKNVDQAFQSQPETSASLHYVLGEVLYELGENAFAADEFDKAFAIYKRVEGEDSLNTLKLRRATLMAKIELSDNPSDEYAALLEVKDKLTEQFGASHPETLRTHITLSRASGTEHSKALAHAKIAYEGFLATSGEHEKQTLVAANNLCMSLRQVGQVRESIAMHERVLHGCREQFGSNEATTLSVLLNLALEYADLGQYDKSLELRQEALHLSREFIGDKHIVTAKITSNLAAEYGRRNDVSNVKELLPQLEQSCQIACSMLGDHSATAMAIRKNLAISLLMVGRGDEAIVMLNDLVEQSSSSHGQNHPETWALRHLLGMFYHRATLVDDSVALLEKVYRYYAENDGPDSQNARAAQSDLLLAKTTQKARQFLTLSPAVFLAREASVSVSLPASQAELAKTMAAQQGMSFEDWLRKAVKAYAETSKGEPKPDD